MATSDRFVSGLATTSEGKQFALIVGVNNSAKSTYLKSLLYAEKDAYGIADILRKPECNFTILEPPLLGKEAYTMAIKEAVTELIDKGTQQDFLLFYFSGHAKPMKIDENKEDVYFITHDFEDAKVKVMPDLYLSMSWLWKALYQQAKANKVLLILDCCYAGKMIGAGNNPYHFDIREVVEQYLNKADEEKDQDRLRLILMATRDSTSALEKDGHGFMTRLLLRALHGEVQEVLDDEGRVNIIFLTQYLEREMQIQPPILWVEGNSKPCILAHYPKRSARFLRETDKSREDVLMSKLDKITSPYFFEKRTQLTYGPHVQPFDHETPSDASLADLDLAMIAEFFKRDLVQRQQDFRPGIPDQDQLATFDFLSQSCPRYGALLCFGQNPQKWLAGSLTRCIHWRSNTRNGGWLDDQEIRGNLLKQFEFSLSFLRKCLRFSRLIDQEGRTEQYEIPFIALGEALANALIHREYANRTDFVQVEVFDDRIEFRSPGDLPAPMTVDLLEVENKCHPRNPQIARIFYLHGYIEKVGSGIQRMQYAMKKAGLPPPKFNLSEAKTLTVTLYRSQQVSASTPTNAIGADDTNWRSDRQFSNEENSSRSGVRILPLIASWYESVTKDMKWQDPLRTFSRDGKRCCPRCHEEFYIGTCNIVATIDVPPYASGEIIYYAPQDPAKARKKFAPLQNYMKYLGKRMCPHCDYWLPHNIDTTPTLNIAVAGDFQSGKSHYIAALITDLETHPIVPPTELFRIKCITPDTKKIYEQKHYDMLFGQKTQLAKTPELPKGDFIDPLIYELTFRRSKDHLPESINIAIHDAAGEHYQTEAGIMEFTRHTIVNAGALIYLANPMSMPEIRKHVLKIYPHVAHPQYERRPSDILNTIIGLIEQSRGLFSGNKLNNLPIAVTISKSDLIDRLCPVPQTFTFSDNPTYRGGINLPDLDKVQLEVQDVIMRYSGDNLLLSATQTIEKRRFFAISATGNPPQSDGTYPSVVPRRCLDPLLWILHEWKIL